MLRGIRIVSRLLCYALCAAGSAYAASSANSLAIVAGKPGDCSLSLRLTDPAISLNPASGDVDIACEILGAKRWTAGSGEVPVYTRILEIPVGREAVIDGIAISAYSADPSNPGAVQKLSDVELAGLPCPLQVSVARQADAAYLKIVLSPFSKGAASSVVVVDALDATISLREHVAVAAMSRAATRQLASVSPVTGCLDCPPLMGAGMPGDSGNPEDFAARRSVTNDVAWKISIAQPGLYRITAADLQLAGVPSAYRDASKLRISARDQVIPVWRSTGGAMSSNDWIMFYGSAIDSSYTTQNVYWLSTGLPSPSPALVDAATNASAVATSSWAVVRYAPRKIYNPAYSPTNDEANWFAYFVNGNTAWTNEIALQVPVRTGVVKLAYVMHGADGSAGTSPDHRTILRLGGATLLDTTYTGLTRISGVVTGAAANITTTSAVVYVAQPLTNVLFSSQGSAYVESFEIGYERRLVATNTAYFFSGLTNPANMRLTGIRTNQVWLLDASNPFQPLQLTNFAMHFAAGSTNWDLVMGDTNGGGHCFALITPDGVRSVPALDLTRFRELSDTNRQADYIAIAPSEFRKPVYELLKHRFKNDLNVDVAEPKDVYNEFGYGVIDPAAIRHYLGFAYHHYQPNRVRYALLVGGATHDPLNNLGYSEPDVIPVKLGWTLTLRTSLEQWFVTIAGSDDLADISFGRIPAFTTADVSNAVRKIRAFDTAPTNADWRGTALLVADMTDTVKDIDFINFSDTHTMSYLSAAGFTPGVDAVTAYLYGTSAVSVASVRSNITLSVNSGVQLLNYIGHGVSFQWSDYNIWAVSNAVAMTNSIYPIVTIFTCMSGQFDQPSFQCMTDGLLLSTNCSSSVLAPTARAVENYSEELSDGFYAAFATSGVARVGDAMKAGLKRLWDSDPRQPRELLFYSIFGDPAQSFWGGARP